MEKLILVKPTLYLPKNITIVGSGKIILKKKNGKEIDKSNYVVRFNFANTDKFKAYAGSKTSLMVINNHWYRTLENNQTKQKNRFLIISPGMLLKHKVVSECFFLSRKRNQYLLALRFIKHFDIFLDLIIILNKKNFSIGLCIILLGIASKLNLKIFGFDLEENMLKREHYYQKQAIGGVHNLVAEHNVLKKLRNLKLIKLK